MMMNRILKILTVILMMALTPTYIYAQSASDAYNKGVALMNKGDYQGAIASFKASMAINKSAANVKKCNAQITKCNRLAKKKTTTVEAPKKAPQKTLKVGTNKIVFDGQGAIIAQVTDRRNIIAKYNVAVIKRTIDFSKDTYNKAFNDFSSFLAGNPKAEDIEANAAQAGYTVQTRNNLRCTEHNVANVRSTREALRWIFDEKTKVGDVSPLYECGENDHLLVLTLAGIHKKGYLAWDDEQIREYLTSEVMKDKKAAMLQEKMKAAKSIADVAKMEGAVTDTIHHITFMSNAFVSKIGASEPALSGSVSKAKKGDFKSGLKGKAAIYAYQVLDQKKSEAKFDQKEEEQKLQQTIARSLGNFQSELIQKADINDKRYIFF